MAEAVVDAKTPLSGGAAVEIECLGRSFEGRSVLRGLDLFVSPGERVGVVGRSGAGKSTLLSLVSGLDAPDAGVVSVGGVRTAAGRLARCALMPQRDCLLPWRTALDNAGIALENAGVRRQEARRRTEPLFRRLGLEGSEGLRPAALSVGMRQRVAFLRTLLAEKPVLLLDEPFGALDAITRSELQEWLARALDDEPRTVLLVTHDVEEALLLCERVLVLADGGIAAEVEVAFPRGGSRQELVTSAPFLELRQRALEAIG